MPADSPRHYLEQEVQARASHTSGEDVRTTCSFARAERLLGREYHGRFLIELLQNAADASGSGAGVGSSRSRVVVQIAEGPSLLVANRGELMSTEVVVESLGHIGASTKAQGEAIGHKGIGFKSVLELTLAPEIYSGLQETSPSVSVGFDPEVARETIRSASPGWDEMVGRVHGLDEDDPYAAVPVLRFPYWVEDLPEGVAEMKERGFDTIVRLPFDRRFEERLGLDKDDWLRTVRDACDDVSDQILLLLGKSLESKLERLPRDKRGPRRDLISGLAHFVVSVDSSERLAKLGEALKSMPKVGEEGAPREAALEAALEAARMRNLVRVLQERGSRESAGGGTREAQADAREE